MPPSFRWHFFYRLCCIYTKQKVIGSCVGSNSMKWSGFCTRCGEYRFNAVHVFALRKVKQRRSARMLILQTSYPVRPRPCTASLHGSQQVGESSITYGEHH